MAIMTQRSRLGATCFLQPWSYFSLYSLQLHLKRTAEKKKSALCVWVAHQTSVPLLLIYGINLWNFLNLSMTALWDWASYSSVCWKPTLIRSPSGTLNFAWHGDLVWEWFVWIYVYAEDTKAFPFWSFLWSRRSTNLDVYKWSRI